MSVSFSGVGSGLPVSDWIEALVSVEQEKITPYETRVQNLEKSKSTLSTLQSKFTSLRSSVNKFTDANILSSFDLFSKKSATLSTEGFLGVTVTNDTPIQNMDIAIKQLATPTSVESVNRIAKSVDNSTKLMKMNNGVVSEGQVSVYADGVKHVLDIDENTDISDLKGFFNGVLGRNNSATVSADGTFTLDMSRSTVSDLKFGSSDDESNLWDFLGFQPTYNTAGNPESGVRRYTSSKLLNKIDYSGNLLSNTANLSTAVTAGTFKIGSAEFTIDESKQRLFVIA